MQFDKQQILSMISDPSQAQQAEQQLPDTIDHEDHAGLLQRFGIEPGQLMGGSGPQTGGGGQQEQFQDSGSGDFGATDQPGTGDVGQGG